MFRRRTRSSVSNIPSTKKECDSVSLCIKKSWDQERRQSCWYELYLIGSHNIKTRMELKLKRFDFMQASLMEYPVIDSSQPHSQILFFLGNIQCSCGSQMYTVFDANRRFFFVSRHSHQSSCICRVGEDPGNKVALTDAQRWKEL